MINVAKDIAVIAIAFGLWQIVHLLERLLLLID